MTYYNYTNITAANDIFHLIIALNNDFMYHQLITVFMIATTLFMLIIFGKRDQPELGIALAGYFSFIFNLLFLLSGIGSQQLVIISGIMAAIGTILCIVMRKN